MRTAASLLLGGSLVVSAWGAPQLQPIPGLGEDKRPRDLRELQLVVAVMGAPDPASQLTFLDQWSQEYPETDYLEVRAKLYVKAYFDGRQESKAVEKARSVLRSSPDHFGSAYVIAALAPFAGPSDAALRKDAETSARVILNWEAKRPARNYQQVEAKKAIRYVAHQCLGWSAMQGKEAAWAEREFVQALENDPTAAQVSLWLAEVALSQSGAAHKTLGLFSLARAAVYDDDNSLPYPQRQEAADRLEAVYKERVAPNLKGLDDLMRVAQRSALPPPGFRIP